MSEPEIARRCHECGASIRDHAAFCPQCGKKLRTTATDEAGSQQVNESTVVETAPFQADSRTSEQPSLDDSAERSAVQSPQSPARTRLAQPKQSSEQPDRTNLKKAGTPLVAGARHKVQRATGIAKHVGGDVVQRGQKLREMSSVVLDEAAYDPSLRFVLVAAVLFFLFMIIVLLNRFIV
ncbi:MAG TPA: zinc ribbon domain-containing protein [Pyrinomonadaceae bacterium]|nr:zinc ribbon domain-containing protein [Pyrinomonadaceae bacterium]